MQRPMRHNERVASCLAHMMGIVPLWGALYMAITYWRYRGRSRRVTFHAAQALLFHLAMLAAATLPLIAVLAGSMIAVLRPALGDLVIEVSVYLLLAVYATNTVFALLAASSVIDEREFDYPLIGARLRPQYQDPPLVPTRTRFPTFTTPQPPDDEFILNTVDEKAVDGEAAKFTTDSFDDEADLEVVKGDEAEEEVLPDSEEEPDEASPETPEDSGSDEENEATEEIDDVSEDEAPVADEIDEENAAPPKEQPSKTGRSKKRKRS